MAALPFLRSRRSPALREAALLAQHARRLVHRRRDLLANGALGNLNAGLDKLETAVRAGDERLAAEATEQLDPQLSRLSPPRADAAWRENCEVFLMAIVVAVAVRAYFFQPFKIPTGSMQPTLNGVIGYPAPAGWQPPNVLVRALDFARFGRGYLNAVSAVDDQVSKLESFKVLRFFDHTRIHCRSGRTYEVWASPPQLKNDFNVYPGRSLRTGDPIARGWVDTGDQVFVDKITYHFRRPHRDDVFVFRTTDIPGIAMDDPNVRSQFYIKRLAGVPGDTLRVAAPELFINGARARGPGYGRVMTARDGYRGYANLGRLGDPKATFTAPPDGYIAMGDNSYSSSDSRMWGPVPERNVVGRGLFVYWPFTRHWGVIR